MEVVVAENRVGVPKIASGYILPRNASHVSLEIGPEVWQ